MIFWLILTGLKIGIELIAAYYVLEIARLRITPTFPYILLLIGLLLRTIILISPISVHLTHHDKELAQLFTSISLAVGFWRIFNLIKNK